MGVVAVQKQHSTVAGFSQRCFMREGKTESAETRVFRVQRSGKRPKKGIACFRRNRRRTTDGSRDALGWDCVGLWGAPCWYSWFVEFSPSCPTGRDPVIGRGNWLRLRWFPIRNRAFGWTGMNGVGLLFPTCALIWDANPISHEVKICICALATGAGSGREERSCPGPLGRICPASASAAREEVFCWWSPASP
jgi:hypothetical protein